VHGPDLRPRAASPTVSPLAYNPSAFDDTEFSSSGFDTAVVRAPVVDGAWDHPAMDAPAGRLRGEATSRAVGDMPERSTGWVPPEATRRPRRRRRRRLLAIVAAVALAAGCAVASASAIGTSGGGSAGATAAAEAPTPVTPAPPPPVQVTAAQVQAALGWSVAELRVQLEQVSFLLVHTEQVRSTWTCEAPGGREARLSGRVAITTSHAATSTPRFVQDWLEGFALQSGAAVGESVHSGGGSGFLACPEGPWSVQHGDRGPVWSEAVTRSVRVYASADGGNRWAALPEVVGAGTPTG
jgi:hypothetical protein